MARLTTRERALSESLDDSLPTEAIGQGYGLAWWDSSAFEGDPVVLYKRNQGVYSWDYIPSMAEVWEKIKELEVRR